MHTHVSIIQMCVEHKQLHKLNCMLLRYMIKFHV